jgi:hypothetical protein
MPAGIAIKLPESERGWPGKAIRTADHPDASIGALPAVAGATGLGRTILGWLEDASLLLLVALLFPVVILVLGTPVALFLRLLIEIARRW